LYRGVLQQTLRQSQQTLRRSEESLRRLVACAPDAIVVADERGRIQQANPQVQALLGYAPDELLGRPLALLMGAHDAARHDAYMAGYETGRRGMTADGREVQARRRDGSLVTVHVRVGEMPFRGGRAFVGFLRDMSERKRAEAEHLRLQRQLLQAQKMQALGQFTGGIAHDFNNMLTGILGLSTLALERHVDDPQGKLASYLREITRVSERGRDLIARLMSFAHPERRSAPVLRPLAPIVEEVLRMLRPAVPERIDLQLQCEPGLPPVRHVEGDVHQMLSNLVLNACDAIAGSGRVQVLLQAAQLQGAECSSCGQHLHGAYLRLAVLDDGHGIAAEAQPRVFDPFFTTKDVGKGTGLGLASVHSLLHQAGGHVLLHSRPGEGTCFELLLPVGDAPP
ncbi:nitrogen regulation protein NR(II), partial [Aquabacterium sp.]|uniref:two-component system sensor histidine kinase NtrB n=1 Tax=Aquabacterium sp. TaxID=1872578 RepID=UPI00378509B2